MNTTRTVTERQEQLNGMALGGIGTGTVEIRPNGCLEDWEIFNLGQWACSDPEKNGKADLPDYDCDVLPFYIRTKAADGQPVVRKLCHSRKIGGFRSVSYSFMKNVEEIRWTPDFPRCCLEYADSRLPVRLKAEYIAPVVPRDYKTSSMPGFYIVFSAANESDQEQEVSLMGTLKNPVNRGLADRGLRNRIFAGENGTTLLMDSTASWEKEQSGSLALSAAGGEISWIVGDYTEYFGAYVLGGELGISEESCLFGFRNTGRLPNQGWEEKKESFLAVTDEELDAADAETLEKWLEDAKGLASGYRPWKRLTEVRPDILETAEGKREFLKVLLGQYREFEQEPFRGWGDGALCSSFRLQPGGGKADHLPGFLAFSPSCEHCGKLCGTPVQPLVRQCPGRGQLSAGAWPGDPELCPQTFSGAGYLLRPGVFLQSLEYPGGYPAEMLLVGGKRRFRYLGRAGKLRFPHHGHHLLRLFPADGPVPPAAASSDADGTSVPAGGRPGASLLPAGF